MQRTGGSAGAIAVNYATANGTALAGTHYQAQTGTLTWSAGATSAATVSIPLSDTVFSGSKTFTVALTNVQGGASLGTATTTVTIVGGLAQTAAAQLAVKLGKPARLLVGLGGGNAVAQIQAQSLAPDIYDRYLVGAGTSTAWPTWNSPSGDYVRVVASAADSVGAIPMFTLYQMATNGDGNLSGLSNSTFMAAYWANVKLMYQKIAVYNKPALVNFEPDFWGYVQLQAANGDPAAMFAYVNSNSDCSTLPNNVVGIAGCLIKMARQYAPKAYVGFPPSSWGAYGNVPAVVSFMNTLGADQADFIVAQTSDRDAGCFEVVPQPSYCIRSGSPWYWNNSGFAQHFANVTIWHNGIGGLPVLWWQTPMGVPSSTAGGADNHYRDNRVEYFLTHPAELVAAGGVGVVFGSGEIHQTDITTDSGQYQRLSAAYLANPTPLQ